MNRILAGIVLYNPEKERLLENIQSIYPQVEKLVLINNNSLNYNLISTIFPRNAVIINNKQNLGIATALNQILQYALDNNYEWVITLDQDSVADKNIIATYKNCIKSHPQIGLICCKIIDRNANLSNNIEKVDGFVDQCITSASMIYVKAWQEVGGFDDSMFIDSVDFDICINLKRHGWEIFKTHRTYVLHEVGHSKIIKIFGKEYLSLNHSPFRYYYIARNNIYIGRKYGLLLHNLKVVARIIWTIIRYEDQKTNKLIKILKGIIDGSFCSITKHIERKKNE